MTAQEAMQLLSYKQDTPEGVSEYLRGDIVKQLDLAK